MMRNILRALYRIAMVLVPIGIGVFIVARAVGDRPPPAVSEIVEAATPVRIITMEPTDFTPSILAYGSIEPVSIWRGIARVAGETEYVHPNLRPGRLIDAGTEIIRIDPTDYKLAQAQAEARGSSAEARLAQLDISRENLEASIAIEQRGLAIGEIELERRRTLFDRGAGSQTAVDQAEEAVLQRRARLQELENNLKLVPVQRRVQEAEGAIAEAQLAEARRNIGHTRITMPFDGRIAEVDAEVGQFAGVGQVLVVAEDVSDMEVTARLSFGQIEPLISAPLEALVAIDDGSSDLDAVPRALGLGATLRFDIGGRTFDWPGEIRGMSFALDPATRTVGLVVGVEEPYRRAFPGKRPPLVKGMFVEIVLHGQRIEGALLLPREALMRSSERDWFVHVVDQENRLERRPVSVRGMIDNKVVVADGLAGGDRVVVSDLPFAVDGMLVETREDEALKARLGGAHQEAVH